MHVGALHQHILFNILGSGSQGANVLLSNASQPSTVTKEQISLVLKVSGYVEWSCDLIAYTGR